MTDTVVSELSIESFLNIKILDKLIKSFVEKQNRFAQMIKLNQISESVSQNQIKISDFAFNF